MVRDTQCIGVTCDNNSIKRGRQSYTETKFSNSIKIKLLFIQTLLQVKMLIIICRATTNNSKIYSKRKLIACVCVFGA